jgi:AcrR family transcriptional regulator
MNGRSTRAPTRKMVATRAAASTASGGAPAQERKLRTQGKKTLRKLLDAAIIVFERRGYHAARVDDIVKVAKTSHGTFYLYFANKEDLFRALLADVAEAMSELLRSLGPVGPSRAGYDELRDWLGRYFDLYEHYHPVIRAWTESEIGEDEIGRLGDALLGGFSRSLTKRLKALDPPITVDPEIGSLAMVAMIERFSYYVVSRDLALDREATLDTLATMLHVGLFGGSRRRTK